MASGTGRSRGRGAGWRRCSPRIPAPCSASGPPRHCGRCGRPHGAASTSPLRDAPARASTLIAAFSRPTRSPPTKAPPPPRPHGPCSTSPPSSLPQRPRRAINQAEGPPPGRPALPRRAVEAPPGLARKQGTAAHTRHSPTRRHHHPLRARGPLPRLPRRRRPPPPGRQHPHRRHGGRLSLARAQPDRRARRLRLPRHPPGLRAGPRPRPPPSGTRLASDPRHVAPARTSAAQGPSSRSCSAFLTRRRTRSPGPPARASRARCRSR